MKNIYSDINNVVSERLIRIDKSHKIKIAAALGLTLAVSMIAINSIPKASTNAEECTTSPCNTTFEVNVQESLSVSITTPDEWAEGDTDEFLRNKIDLDVSTNSSNGFSAYMHSKDTTDLTNANPTAAEIAADTAGMYKIETLATSATRGNFTTNKWGYSLSSSNYDGNSYGETDNGNADSTYYPMSTSNIKIMNGTTSGSEDVYFGTKADMTKASGSYLGTVVFAVVTSNVAPTPSDDPANPTDDTPSVVPANNGATYDNNNNRTVYTSISRSGSGSTARTTTTTQVTDGDVTGSYAPAQGESKYTGSYNKFSTESNTSSGSEIATGLAIASATAATSGMIFFILAKRREEDEEDEQEQQ